MNLKAKKLVTDIRMKTVPLGQMIDYIRNFGNMHKRKSFKMNLDKYLQCRNNIINMPLVICVASEIIGSSKKLEKKYHKLLDAVYHQIEIEIKEAKGNEIRKQVKKEIVDEPRKKPKGL